MKRRGFALLSSLWLMVAIASVALEISWLARTRRLATANALDAEQARAAAYAGAEHARSRLTAALAIAGNDALADPWRFVGASGDVALERSRYIFDVRDDAATLDVNRATTVMLAQLFRACGADAADAARAADRIADWRDADTTRRALGAERADYLAVNARAVPTDGSVQAIPELDDVLDMPREAWRCVRPLLSVSGNGLINPNTAPVEVLQALPGISAPAAHALVAHRRTRGRMREFRELLAAAPAGYRSAIEANASALRPWLTYRTDVMRVTSRGRVEGSPVSVTVESLMRRAGASVFVEWQAER